MSVYCKESPNFFRQALESLVNQTKVPNEIVLVKDGLLTKDLDDLILEYVLNYPNLIKIVPWVIEAYEQKKYAFAADYIRFYALYNYGGIYLDSDVEILKSFNDILDNKSFISYEIGGDFEAAVIGAEKDCEWVKKCLEAFDEKHFVSSNGRLNMTPVPLLINTILNSNYDLSKSNIDVYYENSELAIFPYYIFSPKNIFTKKTI